VLHSFQTRECFHPSLLSHFLYGLDENCNHVPEQKDDMDAHTDQDGHDKDVTPVVLSNAI